MSGSNNRRIRRLQARKVEEAEQLIFEVSTIIDLTIPPTIFTNLDSPKTTDCTILTAQMPPSFPRQILLCSIGNPSKYINTRHSAGHFMLNLLRTSSTSPPFSHSRAHGGLLATGPKTDTYAATLFQSPEYMNESGKAVKSAWKEFTRSLHGEEKESALLVILHDELEREFGQVQTKETGSARGHNGLKSIESKLGTKNFLRIAIGIGRPEARSSDEVSKYVLSKLQEWEKEALKDKSLPLVYKAMSDISTRGS